MEVENRTTDVTNNQETPIGEAAPTSALRDNIEKKGKNAYYFAHAHKATGPKWDGKVEPRLLSRCSSSDLSNELRQATSSFQYYKSNITKYAFLDETKKVKLYVDLEGVGEKCPDENISLDFGERSLCLLVEGYSEEKKCLSFGRLYSDITSASFKKKPNKIILILQKKEEKEWPRIGADEAP